MVDNPQILRPPHTDRVRFPLWVKLTGAFLAVILVGILFTVLLTRQGTASQVSHIMVGNQMVDPLEMQQTLAAFYAEEGSWTGVESLFPQIVHRHSRGPMGNMMGRMMGAADGSIRLLDADGRLVAAVGRAIPPRHALGDVEEGWPLIVGGSRVGTLIIEGRTIGITGTSGALLIARVTRSVLVAGLLAGLVALILGVLLIRQVTRPLAALNRASQQIAAGKMDVQVPVQSRDELGQLAQTFNEMATTLQIQESLRRNLMADVAHELRTPLSGIQGTVEAMQDGVFPLTPENLESIHEQVALLTRLVEDLRTLAHAEAGQLPLELESIDLAELASRQVAAHRLQAWQKQVELTCTAPEDLPPIRGDEKRLGQVLGNLLNNALHHTPSGGQIAVELSAQDGIVEIRVVDSGEGIAAADLPHIFDRFYRGDRSRSRQSGGSGLGLSIVRQLVDAHGGRIQVESPPPGLEQGSAFVIHLPANQQLLRHDSLAV
jgi:signal transduction histidine kinase